MLIVVGLVAKFFFSGSSDSPRYAKVGDCLHVTSTAPGSDANKTECSDSKANYTVAKRYEYDGVFSTRTCQDVPGAFSYHGRYYRTVHHHRVTHTYLLCLTPRNGTSGNPAPTGQP